MFPLMYGAHSGWMGKVVLNPNLGCWARHRPRNFVTERLYSEQSRSSSRSSAAQYLRHRSPCFGYARLLKAFDRRRSFRLGVHPLLPPGNSAREPSPPTNAPRGAEPSVISLATKADVASGLAKPHGRDRVSVPQVGIKQDGRGHSNIKMLGAMFHHETAIGPHCGFRPPEEPLGGGRGSSEEPWPRRSSR